MKAQRTWQRSKTEDIEKDGNEHQSFIREQSKGTRAMAAVASPPNTRLQSIFQLYHVFVGVALVINSINTNVFIEHENSNLISKNYVDVKPSAGMPLSRCMPRSRYCATRSLARYLDLNNTDGNSIIPFLRK
jgi:hypothetical protein